MSKRLLPLLLAPLRATSAHLRFISHKQGRVAAGLVLASALGICATTAAIRTAAASTIVNTVGLTVVPAPQIVTGDFIINSNGALPPQLIFAEQQNFTLVTPLVTDTGTILAGTIVDSYYFAVNVWDLTFANTSVTFSTPILGIVYKAGPADPNGPNPGPFNPNFANSDFLGATGTVYSLGGSNCSNDYITHVNGVFCGFEPDTDSAAFLGNSVFFNNRYSGPGDFARIITAAAPLDAPPLQAVPGPIVGAGLPGLILAGGGLLGWCRRRRSRSSVVHD